MPQAAISFIETALQLLLFEEIKRAGKVEVSHAILQLDAALSIDPARRKAAHTSKRPNILMCTDLGVANAIYKTLEIFGRPSVQLSGAIMMGLNKGLIGLLPRTCRTEEVCRLFSNLVRATRGLPTNEI
jgi:phosphotransacetylase